MLSPVSPARQRNLLAAYARTAAKTAIRGSRKLFSRHGAFLCASAICLLTAASMLLRFKYHGRSCLDTGCMSRPQLMNELERQMVRFGPKVSPTQQITERMQILNISRVQMYPHYSNCRMCKVCVPQTAIDAAMTGGTEGAHFQISSSSKGRIRRLPGSGSSLGGSSLRADAEGALPGRKLVRRALPVFSTETPLQTCNSGGCSSSSRDLTSGSSSSSSSNSVQQSHKDGQQQRTQQQQQQQQQEEEGPGGSNSPSVLPAGSTSTYQGSGSVQAVGSSPSLDPEGPGPPASPPVGFNSAAGTQEGSQGALGEMPGPAAAAVAQTKIPGTFGARELSVRATDPLEGDVYAALDSNPSLAPGSQQVLDGAKSHRQWSEAHGGANSTAATAVPGVTVVTASVNHTFEWEGQLYQIAPAATPRAGELIRSCPICRGCQHQIEPMPKGMHWMGSYYAHEVGASSGWLVKVATDRVKEGAAAVKVWCVPVMKPGARGLAPCKPERIRHQIHLVMAQQHTARDCGLTDILPSSWVGRLQGPLPGTGFMVDFDGLWSELADGLSLENLANAGKPRTDKAMLLDFLETKLNSTQVVMAAIFDLLFSQCDRHPQNMYVSPSGGIMLIDNDQAYGSSWRLCGVDSLFLPGTQKHEVARLGFRYVLKKPRERPYRKPKREASPIQLFDYRCHAPGGAIGKQYPPQVQRCLEKIASLGPTGVQKEYNYPNSKMAWALHQRASSMLSKGFEWTLKHGQPANPSPARYRWAPACCKQCLRDVKAPKEAGTYAQKMYFCEGQKGLGEFTEIPRGEPAHGRTWNFPARDTGTYNLTELELQGGDW